ncbi:methionyl-tRNA formyltransferase [Sphingomonas sp. T9W2]|uniref:methionyl-tRNA formyltransferase n=1 Tax=Sphingomonas sp. T9W2 TaxID=3143183 RepID=UPI0031F53D37
MRIIFMGTPEFAVPIFQALVDAGHDLVAVYSQPPRRAGRGKALTPSPVHRLAESLGIGVRVPATLRDPAVQADFQALKADVAVVAAYGLLLPRVVLDAPRLGCLNVHGSLLPRWRGAAPIQRAILAGDTETGVGIMQMAAGMDTGPVRLEGRTPVADKTAGELAGELSAMGARLMLQVLANPDGYPPIEQASEGVTHAAKIDKSEARLRFDGSAVDAERQVRAYNPAPGAFFELNGERVRVLAAEVVDGAAAPGTVMDDALTIACAEGALRPTRVQRAGRGAMTPAELLRGFAIPEGTRLA